jgi:ubiquinone/menaquinone biosynthesis C-methylase UbiE
MTLTATRDDAFVGSIPEIYDRFLVPLIFESYARDLAQRVKWCEPHRILETAAGTGVLTRALARELQQGTQITATDLNKPMIDYAQQISDFRRKIEWRQADALALPFPDASFDVVACQFGAMFFPDKVKGYAEAHRVLKPDGRFLFNVWDRISDNEFADVVTEALAEIFPDDPPRFMARTPHGYSDPEKIKGELAQAGFTKVLIESVEARSKAQSAREPAVAYCHGTPLRNEIEARGSPGLQVATDRATEALRRRFGNGVVDGRIKALVVSAIR